MARTKRRCRVLDCSYCCCEHHFGSAHRLVDRSSNARSLLATADGCRSCVAYFDGRPKQSESWNTLHRLLSQTWPHAHGAHLGLAKLAIAPRHIELRGCCAHSRDRSRLKKLTDRSETGIGLINSGLLILPASGLRGLARCGAQLGRSACLDIDCLGGLYGLSGLLDPEMQYALVEMSVDGSIFWLEWQRHRTVE
jgi:hypothetical protein